MREHEEFEQLCALAIVGDASQEELSQLRQHLKGCESCRSEYRDFSQLVLPQLWALDDRAIPGERLRAEGSTRQLRQSFLARAKEDGIVFSPETLKEPATAPKQRPAGSSSLRSWQIAAAAACFGCVALLGWRIETNRKTHILPASAPVVKATVSHPLAAAPTPKPDLKDVELGNLKLQQVNLQKTLADLQDKLATANADRTALKAQFEAKTSELLQAQASESASQQANASLRDQMAASQTRANSSEATYIADQAKIAELADQVTRAHQASDHGQQLLAAGKDMRDMMAARNLHIVDVVDTDPKGHTKHAFGRIFFAEDRQLVFYAYDLNEKRLQDAHYDYRIWGERQGQPKSAKSLGIFYSDNKTEQRWVFKCDDPKVLSEIDTVFVTLEPSDASSPRPNGPQLMYAYLRGQPNHP